MIFVSLWIRFPIQKWRTDSGFAIKQMKDCLPTAANSIAPYSLLEENPENPTVTHRRIWPSVKDLCLEYQHWQMLQNHIWFIKTTSELIIKISKYFPLLLHQEQTTNSISVISLMLPFWIFCLLAAACEFTNNVCLLFGLLKKDHLKMEGSSFYFTLKPEKPVTWIIRWLQSTDM